MAKLKQKANAAEILMKFTDEFEKIELAKRQTAAKTLLGVKAFSEICVMAGVTKVLPTKKLNLPLCHSKKMAI